MSGDQSPSLLPHNLSQETKTFSNLAVEVPTNLTAEMPSNLPSNLTAEMPSHLPSNLTAEMPLQKSPSRKNKSMSQKNLDSSVGMKQLSLDNSEDSVQDFQGGTATSPDSPSLHSNPNTPVLATRKKRNQKVSPLGNSKRASPTPSSGKNSPVSNHLEKESSLTGGKNSPAPSIKAKFFSKVSPSPRRKNVAYLSEDVSQTVAGTISRCSSPMTEKKFQFLQNWSFFSRSPDVSPSLDRKSQKKGMSDKESFQVAPSYSYLSDQLRRVSAGSFQCAIFCGGQNCKYEGAAHWGENEMAIKGLYSHWVTDDVLAMARPSAKLFQDQSIIKEFKRQNISTVINLQQPGEHAQCGNGLVSSSGFSYRPEDLMDNGVYFYNYGWADYGVPTLHSLLGMVKVMDFALSEGKVAVHCHAGLGRTGVLIACYLVYSRRLSGDQAIAHVRQKRSGSIQTRPQVEMVRNFSQFLSPLWMFFPSPSTPLSLEELLQNQVTILHGDQDKNLKLMPKVMQKLCDQLVKCCSQNSHSEISKTLAAEKSASLASELAPPSIQVTDSSTIRVDTAQGLPGNRHKTVECVGEKVAGGGDLEDDERVELQGVVGNSLTQWCSIGEQEEGEMDQQLEDMVSAVNGSLDWSILSSQTNITCLLNLCSRFLLSLKDPVVIVEEDDEEGLSWLLTDHTHSKDWKKHCSATQYLVEKLAHTFGVLLHYASKESPSDIDNTGDLVRGVARRLAMDLCQDDINCGQCEEVLVERWRQCASHM